MSDRLKMIFVGGVGFAIGAVAVLAALGVGAWLGGSGAEGSARAMAPQQGAQDSYAEAVARAAPSVLRVFGRHAGADAPPTEAPVRAPAVRPPVAARGLSRGSAVLVSDDGLLVTSGHLVSGAEAIGVEVPGRGILDAQLLGVDAATDLAVLRLEQPAGPAIEVGRPKALRAGDVVLAVGNPFGLDQTVSLGIVSAVGRTHLGLTEIEDFIQTDAEINPGNSGGALIDTRGRLVGINTAIMSDSGYSEGVAFAIPADQVMRVVGEIVDHGNVIRGWIGIGARTLDATLAQRFGVRAPRGVFVTRVLDDSPAAAADLRVGDVIVKAGSRPVTSSLELREAISVAGAGRQIVLELWRGSERLSARVETALRPQMSASASAKPAAGTPGTVAAHGCGAAGHGWQGC